MDPNAHEIAYDIVDPGFQPGAMAQIRDLLAARGLDADASVEVFVVGRRDDRIVACAGLAGDVIKCVALDESLHGTGTLEELVTELTYVAVDRGHGHLFLYTKPRNERAFLGCGFHTIVTVPDTVVLMENTRNGIGAWTEGLSHFRRERAKVGAVVVNCNPYTRGHEYLLQQAARACDYLHVFVVSEDASFVPYDDRLALVRAGVAALPERDHIHVHPGSAYLVSKATFPTYFIKDAGIIDMAATAVDLRIFRRHIAPALGITHRFVGTEPYCRVTRRYNADMHHWLEGREHDPDEAAPVSVVEIPRLDVGGTAISATEVRRRIAAGELDGLDELVPPPTYAWIVDRFGSPQDKERATAAETARAARDHDPSLEALHRAFAMSGDG